MSLLRKFFLDNLVLKSVSLLLAVLLWNQVSSLESVQRTVSAPIVFRDLPRGLEISNDHPPSVDVTLRTSRAGAASEGVTAVIDMKAAEGGMNVINLTEQDIKRGLGVEVLTITPARIRLYLEPTSSKRIQMDPDIQGQPAEGFEVTKVQAVPPDVLVSGPESHIKGVSSASTGPIDVSGRSATFSQTVFVDLEDTRLRLEGDANVNVVVTIEEKRRPVTVRNVPVVTVPEHVHTRLYTQQITIEGTVPISFDETIRPELFQASVDVSTMEVAETASEFVPRVVIPQEYTGIFRLRSFQPDLVRVRRTR